MEGRPIVRRWRRLQRGPFVLYSWPFSSVSNYTCYGRAFNPVKTGIAAPAECEFHGQVKSCNPCTCQNEKLQS